MKKHIIRLLVIIAILNLSCSNEFDQVVPDADLPADQIFNNIDRARNFLNPAYTGVIQTPLINLEYHTNNAININGAERTAVSGPTAESSPVASQWNGALTNIFRINEFFERATGIQFDALNEDFGIALKRRTIGEAYGLRAYYKWLLLKNFAGLSATDGTMLGIPIIDDVLTIDNANNVARSTYIESYNNIKKDLDSAYKRIDVLRYQGDDDVTGDRQVSRISREMIWALRARLDLFSASPVYSAITWEQAAQTAYDAIVAIDGTPKGLQGFGDFSNTNNIDHLWRRGFSENADLEKEHYPPSMFGQGIANPSQNLVDAFADINGYPISHSNSVYNGISPYENREGRFERFIFYNGQNDYRSSFIEIFNGGKDAVGGVVLKGTRTGFYLKKFLSERVNLDIDVGATTTDNKIYPIFTRAALYLDFAEAAVEAFGVNGRNGSMVFSAKDALQTIRQRAGIPNDLYIDEADDFLNTYIGLIHNERRLEFAFEGEYYYDVRRWMLPLDELTQPVRGVNIIKEADDSFTFVEKIVESRNFTGRMYYNPIPRAEILKSDALIQNAGWE